MNGKKDIHAFPFTETTHTADAGMTLRDYFAIHADWDDVRHYSTDGNGHNISRTTARYKYADAMLAARDK